MQYPKKQQSHRGAGGRPTAVEMVNRTRHSSVELDGQSAQELLNPCNQNKSRITLPCQVPRPEPIFRHGTHSLNITPDPQEERPAPPCQNDGRAPTQGICTRERKMPGNLRSVGPRVQANPQRSQTSWPLVQ